MKNIVLTFYCLLAVYVVAIAQPIPVSRQEPPNFHSHAVTPGLLFPLATFSQTHIAGLGVGHYWSRHRFGSDSITHKKFGFIVSSGLAYLFGREAKTAGHDFRFGNYFSVYSMPGLVYQPLKKGLVSLNTGPFLAVYKGHLNAGIGARFATQYSISRYLAIGPGIVFKKRPETSSLWMVALTGVYAL